MNRFFFKQNGVFYSQRSITGRVSERLSGFIDVYPIHHSGRELENILDKLPDGVFLCVERQYMSNTIFVYKESNFTPMINNYFTSGDLAGFAKYAKRNPYAISNILYHDCIHRNVHN
jgi:hypothetical protein